MRARWVFQFSLTEVFCRSYSDWMTPREQNRSFFQIVIKLQNSHSPKGRSTSIRQKIGNGSVAAKSRGDCAIAGVLRKGQAMEDKGKTFSTRLVRWAAELVLVFVGVYAAFWLNNYQQHQQEANRRDQILASLERILRQGIESGNITAAKEEQQHAGFKRGVEVG